MTILAATVIGMVIVASRAMAPAADTHLISLIDLNLLIALCLHYTLNRY